MTRNKNDFSKRWITVAGLLLAFFILGLMLFKQAGNWLVVADKPVKADAIVVLMGAVHERIPEAVNLYKAEFASQLIFPDDYEDSPPEVGPDGSLLHNDAAKARRLSNQFNIPDSLINIVKGPAINTQAEAEIIAAYLEHHPGMDSLLLVTSPYHSRRASFIFRNEFSSKGLNITLISVPSRYSTFNPGQWWQSANDRSTVFLEYTKIAYNLLWDKWF